MKTLDGTHGPMAAQVSGATCVPVSHGVAFVAVKRNHANACGSPNKKTRERFVSRGFFRPSPNRIGAIGGAGDRT
ncbi:hypothetical protein [Burkholderia anthina]|uniref:hypothetical protein n=1 Tax=Burkholderia anthina TaxID=179879 RepID=UPI001AA055E9|nr:hypothetical protein [Burkholderia anthina]QTD88446.1 hypothetical protein J4G50_11465 [Burkholderia anthina]